jgi:hypothetical protein
VNHEHELDPQINEAITRLQQKMQDVNHSLAETKIKTASRSSRNATSKGMTGRRTKKSPILARLMGLSVIAVISLGIASYIGPQIEQMARLVLSDTVVTAPAQTTEIETNTVNLAPEIIPASPALSEAPHTVSSERAEPTAIIKPAAFQLTSASYEVQDTDSGPTLEISVSVANIGGQDGRPNVLEITLVDKKDASLMSWPMVLSGAPIPAGNQTVYRTRLVEPPEDFANVQVSMPSP